MLSQMSQLVCANTISTDTCNPHQVSRSAQCSTGTGGFETCRNACLSSAAKKNHTMHNMHSRPLAREKMLAQAQTEHGGASHLTANPAAMARWNSCLDEAARTNAAQSDLDETTRCLITRGACKDLAAEEKENMRFGRAEKEILSQLEVACKPAKVCSTFVQASKAHVHHDDLANAKTMLSLMKPPSFMMLEDLSNCQSVKDLHARK